MSVLTVGSGMQFATISAAIGASHDGDTLYVKAGTYLNDSAIIRTKINIVGVGGMAHLEATVAPKNAKALLVTNTDVSVDHLEFSGVKVFDKNGAGIRFQGNGTLTVTNSYFHDNQDGILGGTVDHNAHVIIDHSEFARNGAGDGMSHNLYIAESGSLTVTNSYLHDAVVGHEVKSRAEITTVLNNRIIDGNSSASYGVDLGGGGVAVVRGNYIQQGAFSQNPAMINYGSTTRDPWAQSSLIVEDNIIVNQLVKKPIGVENRIGVTAQIHGNHFYGLTSSQIAVGQNAQSGNDTLSSIPVVDTSHPWAESPWDNLVWSGASTNVLNGTTGRDLFVGSAGNDTFVIQAGGRSDTIAAFNSSGAPDVVRLEGTGLSNFAAVTAAMAQTGNNVVLNLGRGETLTFQDRQIASFSASNFAFSATVTGSPSSASVENPAPVSPPPSDADTTAPTLSIRSPADNASNVLLGANIVMTFSEAVKTGAGDILLRQTLDNSILATIPIIDSSQVTIAGNIVTINPTSDLAPGTGYSVIMASGVLLDLAGNAFRGISSRTDFNFTTAQFSDLSIAPLSTDKAEGNAGTTPFTFQIVRTGDPTLAATVHWALAFDGAPEADASDFSGPTSGDVSFAAGDLNPKTIAISVIGDKKFEEEGLTEHFSVTLSNPAGAALKVSESVASGAIQNDDVRKVTSDFDADGHSDALWQSDSGQPAIWLINGTSVTSGGAIHYVNLTPTDPGPTWHVKGSGDFDGDGKADVLWQDDNGQPAAWLMDGFTLTTGGRIHYVDLTPTNPGVNWHVKGSGDFNGDGKSDILWQDDGGEPAIWLVNGFELSSGGMVHYADLTPATPGPTWHIMGSGDFNSDGKSDILWQEDGGQAAVWLMDGFALMSGGGVGPNMGPSWHVKGAGDFDGDGKADIVWQHDDGHAAVWLMDGATPVTMTELGTDPDPAWRIQGTGDFNSDGKSDILWQSDAGQTAVWLMNGTDDIEIHAIGDNVGPSWHLDWT